LAKFKKRIFLLDVDQRIVMDFINHPLKRLNLLSDNKLGFTNPFPKIAPSEIEQLNDNIFNSIKIRTEYMADNQNNQESFEKMVKQMRGQDTSNISDLTKDFERKTKRNY
jgi:hypothetical protein